MTFNEAKKFIEYLHSNELMFHFDDGAVDCLYRNNVCSLADARAIDEKLDAIYEAEFDWGHFGCPIGYSLALIESEA